MPLFSYARKIFRHDDWVDNVDRVQAGGDNGFNERFHAIEAELDVIGKVVQVIDTEVSKLGDTPAQPPVRTSLSPTLVAIGAAGWSHVDGMAVKPGNAAAADGMMVVNLPHGSRIVSLRAVGSSGQAAGSAANANIRIRLRRQAVVGPGGSETIATIPIDGPNDPFDVTVAANASFERVNNDQFKYYITASVSSAGQNDPIQLRAFQIITSAS